MLNAGDDRHDAEQVGALPLRPPLPRRRGANFNSGIDPKTLDPKFLEGNEFLNPKELTPKILRPKP